jgi:hypothetical protein
MSGNTSVEQSITHFSGQEIGIDLVGAEVKYDLGELI